MYIMCELQLRRRTVLMGLHFKWSLSYRICISTKCSHSCTQHIQYMESIKICHVLCQGIV